MFVIVIVVVLIILIIILTIRYMQINADVLSREEFKMAADNKTKKLKKEDPIITCDYCGSTIDTRIHTHCPNCGAPYGEDTQWHKRNEIDGEWIDDNARIAADIQRKKAEIQSASTAKGLKYTIVVLISFMIFIAALFAVSVFLLNRTDSRKDEPVNTNSYDNYTRANYHVVKDDTIFEHDGVAVKITGFYTDKKTYSYSPIKIEFTVENNTNKKQRIVISAAGINGVAGSSLIFVYDIFDPGTTVFYERVYFTDEKVISEIVFDNITIEEKDNYNTRFENSDIIRVKTSAELSTPNIEPQGNLIYSSDLVDIYSENTEGHRGYQLYIQNKSEYDFMLNCKDLMVDDKTVEYYGIHNETLPAGYRFEENNVQISDDVFDGYEDKEIKLSISFSCKKDPSKDFSTGYIELK